MMFLSKLITLAFLAGQALAYPYVTFINDGHNLINVPFTKSVYNGYNSTYRSEHPYYKGYHLKLSKASLPQGWEERIDAGTRRKYYVDNNTKRFLSWIRPDTSTLSLYKDGQTECLAELQGCSSSLRGDSHFDFSPLTVSFTGHPRLEFKPKSTFSCRNPGSTWVHSSPAHGQWLIEVHTEKKDRLCLYPCTLDGSKRGGPGYVIGEVRRETFAIHTIDFKYKLIVDVKDVSQIDEYMGGGCEFLCWSLGKNTWNAPRSKFSVRWFSCDDPDAHIGFGFDGFYLYKEVDRPHPEGFTLLGKPGDYGMGERCYWNSDTGEYLSFRTPKLRSFLPDQAATSTDRGGQTITVCMKFTEKLSGRRRRLLRLCESERSFERPSAES